MARLRAYLAEATYDWIVDQGFTPYFLVDAEIEGVEVPFDYVEQDKIVLNAAPEAVQYLDFAEGYIGFQASFSGSAMQVFIPDDALLAIYARETNQGIYAREGSLGMMVNESETEADLDPNPPEPPTDGKPNNPRNTIGLHVVK